MTSGTDGLRVTDVSVGIAEFPAGAELAPYESPLFEFVWVLEGSGTWIARDLRAELRPGEILLLRPHGAGRFEWDRAHPTRHAWAEFALTDTAGVFGAPDAWPHVLALPNDGPLPSLFRYVLWLGQQRGAEARARLADVLELAVLLWARGPLPPPAATAESEPVSRAIGHARAAWASGRLRHLDLDELAGAAAVSRGHLSRLFRAEFGVGAVTAFEHVRLARAAAMLGRTTMSVAAVSAACGFANPYHFSRRFSRLYGLPPRAYRRARGSARRDPLAATPLARLAERVWSDAAATTSR